MKLKRKQLLYFGLLTVAIEWIAIFIGSMYAKNFDFNNALSTLSSADSPLPFIFATTLILVGVTYSIFCLSLKQYSTKIPIIGVMSGVFLGLTGVLAYTGKGGIGDAAHNLAIITAVLGYSSVIYIVKDHPMNVVQQASKWLFKAFIFGIILATITLFFIDRYVALTQLFILFIIQIWTIIIVWHDRNLE